MKFSRLFDEKGLSMERLAALVEVDDAGGIANAEPDDDSRQSLISRQISQLEEFFDIELKNKTGKTVRLTPAGKHLAKLAREHLQSLEEFQRSCRKQRTEVVIGAGDSLLQWLWPMAESFPGQATTRCACGTFKAVNVMPCSKGILFW